MAVLVSGGAGYIGSHMVLHLCEAGEKVVVVDNLSTGFDWAIDSRALFIPGNVADQDFITSLVKEHDIDAIIHFAGSIVVPESVINPLKYYGDNTSVSRNLLAAAVSSGVKHFIFSSTAAVYGETDGAPLQEDSALNPMSPYGRSKLMTEMMLADVAAAHPLTYGVLRYFNVAGADVKGRTGQSFEGATHLIKIASEAASGKRTHMNIFGDDYDTPDGTCVRDYIHVSDLAAAHGLLLGYLRAGGKSNTFNCGYGSGYSVNEVIETVKAVSGVDFEVRMEGRRAGDPASLIAGADRIRNELNWKPAHEDIKVIVSSAFEWEKKLQLRNR
jgi:UDP-glucose 4-epimerase